MKRRRQEQAQNKDRETGTKPGVWSGTQARGKHCPWDEAQYTGTCLTKPRTGWSLGAWRGPKLELSQQDNRKLNRHTHLECSCCLPAVPASGREQRERDLECQTNTPPMPSEWPLRSRTFPVSTMTWGGLVCGFCFSSVGIQRFVQT